MTDASPLDRSRTALVVVDLQPRLLAAMPDPAALLARASLLIRTAVRLGVPVLFTEQYPRGLGATVPELRGLAPHARVVEKIHFDATAELSGDGKIRALDRPVVAVCGAEAHVCVLQTAFGLRRMGLAPTLIADAVASRRDGDRHAAFDRARDAGIGVATVEMAAFEWLGRADTAEFRDLLPHIKQL